MYQTKKTKGFTLIEILLVIALIAILATAIIVALNPRQQIVEANNTARTSHINAILSAVNQYMVKNKGILPDTIPITASCNESAANQICLTGVDCVSGVDLSVLTDNQLYMVSMPVDPYCESTEVTCYSISQSENGRVTVCAPEAEGDVEITATM
jgi:prepilin-type N-terminal cleavage/methylation domain-containing protein